MGFISSMNEFATKLDFFAYIPAFYINRNSSFKSPLGGYFYLGYVLFFGVFVIYSLSNFISQQNQIISIKENLAKSRDRNFNSSDINFGVGLLDQDFHNLNWNDFPQLEIIVNSIINNKKTTFNLSYCQESLMFSYEDWNQMSQQDQITKQNVLNTYYLCPDDKFKTKLNPKNLFYSNISYFEIIVKIKNLSMINSTINLIKSNRPIVQLIWGSYALLFNNFSNPIYTYVDKIPCFLRNNIISTSEIKLQTMILFDNQIIGNTLNPYKSELNINQEDGALFNVGKESIRNEDIFDRSKSLENDENLVLKRYEFKLDYQRREFTRYRTNFTYFITTLTSIPSLVLFILIIIMEKVNVTLAKNHLFKGLFSLKYFNNISNFQSEYLKRFSVLFFLTLE